MSENKGSAHTGVVMQRPTAAVMTREASPQTSSQKASGEICKMQHLETIAGDRWRS